MRLGCKVVHEFSSGYAAAGNSSTLSGKQGGVRKSTTLRQVSPEARDGGRILGKRHNHCSWMVVSNGEQRVCARTVKGCAMRLQQGLELLEREDMGAELRIGLLPGNTWCDSSGVGCGRQQCRHSQLHHVVGRTPAVQFTG